MYLLDTNIFIRALQGGKKESSFLSEVIKENKTYISVIVISEFLVGANEKEKEFFMNLIAQFSVLEIDKETAIVAAEYRKELLRKEKKTILQDCFIAAQTKLNSLTLVTNNKSDFPMKDIKIISL